MEERRHCYFSRSVIDLGNFHILMDPTEACQMTLPPNPEPIGCVFRKQQIVAEFPELRRHVSPLGQPVLEVWVVNEYSHLTRPFRCPNNYQGISITAGCRTPGVTKRGNPKVTLKRLRGCAVPKISRLTSGGSLRWRP